MAKRDAPIMQYNLTQRERQILIELLKLSKNSKAGFEARVDVDAQGPARELARLDFALAGKVMDLAKRDLRVLKDEGLILFRWHTPDQGVGRLTSLAFDAVGSNFQDPAASSAAAVAAAAAASASALIIADEKAIALRFEKITARLVNLTRDLIDADEAQAAGHEARAIARSWPGRSPMRPSSRARPRGSSAACP
jgi:hypothetical protein